MVILRATRRVLRFLPAPEGIDSPSDTALGDWYVNRFIVDRRPVLILVSARSLLPILAPARQVRSLPGRLPGIVSDHLRRLGVPDVLAEREIGAMAPVRTAPTRDRSVVGSMVEFGRMVTYHLSEQTWNEDALPELAVALAHTPCCTSRPGVETVWPDRAALELLEARWS